MDLSARENLKKTNRNGAHSQESLSPARQALLDQILKGKKDTKENRITKVPRQVADQTFPLSFAQQRQWFIHQFDPKNPLYNMSSAHSIHGELDIEALHHALQAILHRHEILRTTIHSTEDDPRQQVQEDVSLDLPVLDLSVLEQGKQEHEIERILTTQKKKPFNLGQDLMIRATLLRLNAEEHILLIVNHHIASDGWSRGVLIRELSTLYEAFSNGKPSPLPDLPIQYRDFSTWQRGWFQGDNLNTQLSFWKEHLKGAPPILELPTDRPRPAESTFEGRSHSFDIPPKLGDAIEALAKDERSTLFMIFLSALKILLFRYTQQEHIVVGSPIANRNRIEIENLIGFFVNTLSLHTQISGDLNFRTISKRVRSSTLEAFDHQDLPFEKLVEELNPSRTMNNHPIFQVMFIYQNANEQTLTLPGLKIETIPKNSETEHFDLTLQVMKRPEGIRGILTYAKDLFDEATIQRMVGHYLTLLESIVDHPELPLAQLPILTESEHGQLVKTWNDTEANRPENQCLHHLIEAQVRRTPQEVAVVFGERQLTYLELNNRANQVAHYLKQCGVGPDKLVGVFLDRSLDMVAGLLGILKAGGAYVPLNPEYPEERLRYILEDSNVSILLTDDGLKDKVPTSSAEIVCLDSDWSQFVNQKTCNPVDNTQAHHLAYVMYTSGSTGQPKGVMVRHEGVCNYLQWRREYFPLTAQDRVLQKTSFSFVDSIWEFFEPMMVGARVYMAKPDGHTDIHYLIETIAQQNITAADFIPSMLGLLLAEPEIDTCRSLRRVTTGSEIVPLELQQQFYQRVPWGTLYNLYGPTEASIASTCWTCQPGTEERAVPIGKPIANTQIFLLDPSQELVPIGIPGEVYIGGTGLARGYLNKPDLTADKFLPSAFGPTESTRLYRTGDLAYHRDDGTLQFLGRIDHQVKLRGFRIELGEIEAALRQHSAVRETIVLCREDEPGDKRLVAYVIFSEESAPPMGTFRDFLKSRLPEYMVPATFVVLETLPLLPNGKVDRNRLPEPEWNGAGNQDSYIAPRTPTEEMLVEIWQEVLKIEKIGIHDNFFDLGGHSLLAMQLISRIRNMLKIDLPLRDIFDTPTIAGLAGALGETFHFNSESSHLPLHSSTDFIEIEI